MQRAGQVSNRIFEIHDMPVEDRGKGNLFLSMNMISLLKIFALHIKICLY